MPTTDGKQLCTSVLANVGELRSWVKKMLDDPNAHANAPLLTFRDLCGLSEELLSAATQLTALAIQVTQAAQILYNHDK
jgi:hypothetical protein